MVNRRFRAIYFAAFVVMCIGLLGTVLVPKAHAGAANKPAPVGVPVISAFQPAMNQRIASSAKPLVGFAGLGVLSSAGLAFLYAKSKA